MHKKHCKFCLKTNHSSTNCKSYPNYSDRLRRADSLNLCNKCLGKFHKSDNCPGLTAKLPFPCAICKKPDHVTPVCPAMIMSISAAKKSNGRD